MSVLVLLDEHDDAALRLGLALGPVTALRAGPPEDDALLQRALRAGATRAVRLWDPVLAETDYLGLATALAAAARSLGRRLVIAGDGAEGAVGPALADRLDLPHLSGVLGAAWHTPEGGAEGDRRLEVERRTTAGRQRLRGPAEAVLCVAAGAAPAGIADGAAEATAGAAAGAAPAGIADGGAVPADATAEAAARAGAADGAAGAADGAAGAADAAAGGVAPDAAADREGPAIEVLGLYDVGLSVAELGHRRWLRAAPDATVIARPRPLCFPSVEELIGRLRQDGLLPRE
jgi:electron transfer flavoprotein alpha/beta subunit